MGEWGRGRIVVVAVAALLVGALAGGGYEQDQQGFPALRWVVPVELP